MVMAFPTRSARSSSFFRICLAYCNHFPRACSHHLAHVARNDMGQNQMRVFFLLDIVTWSEDVGIHHSLNLAAFCSKQPDSSSMRFFRQPERIDHILRVTARADTDDHVTGFDHIRQLLGKDVFICCIIAPGCNQGYMVCQRDGFQTRCTWHNSVLCKVKRKMRCSCSTSTISNDEDTVALLIGALKQQQNLLKRRQGDSLQHLPQFAQIAIDQLHYLFSFSTIYLESTDV